MTQNTIIHLKTIAVILLMALIVALCLKYPIIIVYAITIVCIALLYSLVYIAIKNGD